MEAGRWAVIAELFDAALEQPVERRSAFVRERAAADLDLATEVLELLDAFDDSAVIEPTVARTDPGSGVAWTGRLVGTYRLDGEIGRGGMSRVFLAHRADDEYERTVAIKLIQPGIFDEALGARLRRERQILARLNHPYIARLFDGDTTEDGLPYIVMEAIDGEPITRHCDRKRLPLKDRLELFDKVCEAVAYAHSHLVVHLDIKPSNILVTEDGVPKLLDFGIGKLLDPGREDVDSAITAATFRPMTPQFASPEQRSSGALTTASDVYSLGVLLYELVAGRLVERRSGASASDSSGAETVTTPVRPSTAARRLSEGDLQARGLGSRRALARRVAGDLDTIVGHALEREPAERYRTVDDFRRDIRSHLEGRPIEARPPSWSYSLRKLAYRQRRLLVIATVLGALGAAALGQIQRERRQAAAARARSQDTVRFVSDVFLAADDEPGREATWSDTLRTGRERAEVKFGGEPQLLLRTLELLARAAYRHGEYSEAANSYARVGELRRAQASWTPVEAAENDLLIARSLRRIPRLREAAERAMSAVAAVEGHPAVPPDLLLELYLEQAEIDRMRGDLQVAATGFEQAVRLSRKEYGDDHARTLGASRRLWSVLVFLERNEDAERLVREVRSAIGAAEPWTPDSPLDHPPISRLERRLEAALIDPGIESPETQLVMVRLAHQLLDVGQPLRARQLLERVLAVRVEIHGAANPRVAATLSSLGVAHHATGAHADSRSAFEQSLALGRREFPDGAWQMSGPMVGVACHDYRDGEPERAVELLNELVRVLQRDLTAGHPRSREIEDIIVRLRAGMPPLGRDADPATFRTRSLVVCLPTDRVNAAGSDVLG